jgi:hypothetical protein
MRHVLFESLAQINHPRVAKRLERIEGLAHGFLRPKCCGLIDYSAAAK